MSEHKTSPSGGPVRSALPTKLPPRIRLVDDVANHRRLRSKILAEPLGNGQVKKKTTVLLVEDHAIVRAGFRSLLGREPDIEVVGEAADGRRGIALTKTLCPDVVLMDIAMPLLNGVNATRLLVKDVPAVKVLMLSAHQDDMYVSKAIEAGAMGFVFKQASAGEVCRAIREVGQGRKFFSPTITRRSARLDASFAGRRGRCERNAVQLTMREMAVLQLIAEGWLNKQIADQLTIGVKTVEKHRAHLMEKLDIHEVAGLTRYAIGEGIIESSVQLTTI